MTEKELLNAIQKSAETVEIPEDLASEHIIAKLHTATNHKSQKQKFCIKWRLNYSWKKMVSATVILLLCGILSITAWHICPDYNTSLNENFADSANFAENEKGSTDTSKTTNPANETSPSVTQPKQNAGSLYTIAKSYDEIYTHLESSIEEQTRYIDMDGGMKSSPMEDTAVTEFGASSENSIQDKQAAKEESSIAGYSTTNLQTYGVDESDRIKTDGRYIYTATNDKVLITDVKDGYLTPTTTITPELEASDSILEIYVDNGKLLLLVQHYETSVEYTNTQTEEYKETTYIEEGTGFLPLQNKYAIKDFSMSTKNQTLLYTYNISDPANPILEGTTTQDGTYHTSRKIGDIIYLFTDRGFSADTLSNDVREEIIPCINDKTIPHQNIYLADKGNQGLILSSINIQKPDEIVDKVMIIHDFVNIYVGTDSIYLYKTDYNEDTITEIAGFSMDNGILNAINATSVKGEVLDTFAINEFDKCLRILTTSYDETGEDSNNLYLLDNNMKLTGSLTGIAKGEQIYAARYFEDTAYFVTYRNTDPLFAVDISDPTSPTLLGELKITGFSEYLHFWENDKLLGIGYETNPDTGEVIGLKLTMFNISNPAELNVIDSIVLKNYIYSPALYDYKAVLADASTNLIGFVGEYQQKDYSCTYDYLLFSWDNDHFSEKMNFQLSHNLEYYYLRGIYINDIFYIANTNEIISFNRSDNYSQIDTLIFNTASYH